MRDLLWDGFEYLQQGGWVMIPLALVSLSMWSLIADRLLTYYALGRKDISSRAALAALADESSEPFVGTGLRRQLLSAFLAARTGDRDLDRSILYQYALKLRPQIRSHLRLISTLAGTAPLLGLLGTVFGMIETFDVIASFGTGNARAMAGGISVALVTTQAGLLVAVPGLLVAAALTRRARRLEVGFDEFSHLLERALTSQRQALAARA